MLRRKTVDAAAACVSAVRTLSSALQELHIATDSSIGVSYERGRYGYINSTSQRANCVLPAPSDTLAIEQPGHDLHARDEVPVIPLAQASEDHLAGRGRWSNLLPLVASCAHGNSHGHSCAACPWPPGQGFLAWFQLQRAKHTRAAHDRGDTGADGGGGAAQKPRRRRLPRFKPSPKIMNTASLRELSDLAAAEVAGWNPKELAAAARRAVSLWRHEQPAAEARVRKMQRLQLLPLSPAAVLPRHPPHGEGAGGAAGGDAAAAAGTQGGLAPATGRARDSGSGSTDDPAAVLAAEGARSCAPAAAAAGGVAPPPEARQADGQTPARRKLSGGVFRTALVEKPLRPHELRLAQLVERLVRAANGRLAEGFGSRELSSLVWSLVSLGYWQQPLLPLVSAFADYGAERMRAADPIAMAMLLQVLAKARAASTTGQPIAGRLLELAPATAAAAVASLPRCLPSCEPRTLAGLLHSCAVLLSPPGPPAGQAPLPALSTGGAEPSATAAASGAPGREPEGPQPSEGPGSEVHLVGHTADALAGLARDVTRECARRRFIGFGPAGLLTAASALTALRQVGGGSDGAGGGTGVVGSGGEEAWTLLAAAAVSPLAPQMARATPQQWALLLQLAELRGGHSRQLLTEGAISAGALPDTSFDGDERGRRGVATIAR